ncbi:hypothetical protein AC623_04185 [Bacillus sp. FJAT-27231]|uniref:YrhK family protein n=1 Tax=Bacillus sp. FJAT-27231 TaxID=1679168 RepID=UPI0006A1BA9A|nr:YrhK family protein [Bacillus sp. FJAT-27231]KMY56035.1 hypothetical protein AC623_04185 [Bacillus sp. FJAT-27231]
MPKVKKQKNFVELKIGKYGLFFNKHYHFISIMNEIMLGIWFLAGSILFLWETTKLAGTILFIIGSAQLLIRPILKIIHGVTLKKDQPLSREKA